MKSEQLYGAIHADSDARLAWQALARERLDLLMAEHRVPVERKILGVASMFQREIEYTFNHYMSINEYKPSHFDCRVHFLLQMGTVKSWSEVAPVLEALALVGFDVDKWTTHDHAATYTRSYKYKLAYAKWDVEDPELIGDVEVELTFNLPGDTDTCKRVLKGYSDEYHQPATPIYELVCEGDQK